MTTLFIVISVAYSLCLIIEPLASRTPFLIVTSNDAYQADIYDNRKPLLVNTAMAVAISGVMLGATMATIIAAGIVSVPAKYIILLAGKKNKKLEFFAPGTCSTFSRTVGHGVSAVVIVAMLSYALQLV